MPVSRFSMFLSFALTFVSFLLVTDMAAARGGTGTPRVVVSPNPVQAGSIHITNPVAIGTGFQPGKTYQISLVGGYDSAAMASISGYVTADKSGSFSWLLQEDLSSGGIPDPALVGPTSTLSVYATTRNGSLTAVASTTLQISAADGTCTISPAAAWPGTPLNVTGSGAPPNARLEAVWYDATGCTCWLFGCNGCTWTEESITLTADSGGNFLGTLTPSRSNNGYCFHEVTILVEPKVDQPPSIVATSKFSICP